MRVLSDHDVIGAVEALRVILTADTIAELAAPLDLAFLDFASLGLPIDAPDRRVWEVCQSVDVVLITGNRTGGEGSMDAVIGEFSGPDRLPVLTLADPKRILRDRTYADIVALSLLDILDRIDTLRGVGRLYLP